MPLAVNTGRSVRGALPVRIIQFVIAIAVVILAAMGIGQTHGLEQWDILKYYESDALAVGAGTLTMIFAPGLLFGMIPFTTRNLRRIHVACDVVLMALWLASFIYLAVQHADTDCSRTFGGFDFCTGGKVNAALAAVEWVLFIISAVLILQHMRHEF